MTDSSTRTRAEAMAPELYLNLEDDGGAHAFTTWVAERPVTFGWRDCDVEVPADVRSSRHMGTLVPAEGTWYLVVPVAGSDEHAKRPVVVQSGDGRWRATVNQGGWLPLPPGGSGTLIPQTTDGVRLAWTVGADVPPGVVVAARLDNDPEPHRSGRSADPDHRILTGPVNRDTAEAWEQEQERLESYLANLRGGAIRSTPPPQLTNRVLDYIVTASSLARRDGRSRMLTFDEVAAHWSTPEQALSAGAVQRAIARGLETFSKQNVPDPLVWAKDPSRVVAVLEQLGVLADHHFDWQDLQIEFAEDPPSTERRLDGTTGPRPQADRPRGWVRSR